MNSNEFESVEVNSNELEIPTWNKLASRLLLKKFVFVKV